jgi:hypothetical protein
MIQRLQSVFLVLASAVMALLFTKPMSFVTIDQALPPGTAQSMLADGVFSTQDHLILLILVILGIILPVITLFLYKNRPLQMKLSRLTIALVSLSILLTSILFYQDYQKMAVGTEVTVQYGYLMLVLAILFLVLALRYIRKDEKLVRSADRLR